MKSIIFYNLYLKNTWKEVTEEILTNRPQTDLVINISFDLRYIYKLPFVVLVLLKFKPKKIFFSKNNAKYGETIGFNKFRRSISLNEYDILTYTHSKGVTKPNRVKEDQWRRFMTYFIMDRFDLTLNAFAEGYHLYGVNLRKFTGLESERGHTSKFTNFWYRGNFVSINLNVLREKVLETPIPENYFGIEAFWGNLTNLEFAYSPFNSGISHYEQEFPEYNYISINKIKNVGPELIN